MSYVYIVRLVLLQSFEMNYSGMCMLLKLKYLLLCRGSGIIIICCSEVFRDIVNCCAMS